MFIKCMSLEEVGVAWVADLKRALLPPPSSKFTGQLTVWNTLLAACVVIELGI